MSGILEKMKILAFLDCNFATPAGVYIAQINPASYSLKYAVEYDKTQAQGTSGKNAKMNLKRPENLEVQIIMDGTGAVERSSTSLQKITKGKGIEAEVKYFTKFMTGMNSDTHNTPFFMINWGSLLFKCVLKTLDINYELFLPSGIPLKAKIDAKFEGSIPNVFREAKEKFSSPDLTHVRTVKSSDTLYNLCDEIYGDPSHYVKVAEVNGISGFRNLSEGQKIYFPPIINAES